MQEFPNSGISYVGFRIRFDAKHEFPDPVTSNSESSLLLYESDVPLVWGQEVEVLRFLSEHIEIPIVRRNGVGIPSF